ncbi:hypothetical protein PoB_004684200 [Plakobranchus ocellatus]|uniref:Uncharacterized protein n=1 Tax=Plakobranchus ocellatus TaxID=259542 RepID=A0AAV4BLR8_9GAST|nr:hypothetical protein PoB_004684200 [Plakobranchus ocellatus]
MDLGGGEKLSVITDFCRATSSKEVKVVSSCGQLPAATTVTLSPIQSHLILDREPIRHVVQLIIAPCASCSDHLPSLDTGQRVFSGVTFSRLTVRGNTTLMG